MENLEMEAITAARGANEEGLGFCPRHVGMAKILAFEWRIVSWMGTLCSGYAGGFWTFYDLSNGLLHRPGVTTSHEAHAARKLF